MFLVVLSSSAEAAGESAVHRALSDAIVCKGRPENAVYSLVRSGSNFAAGYASAEFGEGTSEKAVVILRQPLRIGEATASVVISEVENSNFDFAAFIYARFEGDYRKVVLALNLQPAQPLNDESLGRFVSQQPKHAHALLQSRLPLKTTVTFFLGAGGATVVSSNKRFHPTRKTRSGFVCMFRR